LRAAGSVARAGKATRDRATLPITSRVPPYGLLHSGAGARGGRRSLCEREQRCADGRGDADELNHAGATGGRDELGPVVAQPDVARTDRSGSRSSAFPGRCGVEVASGLSPFKATARSHVPTVGLCRTSPHTRSAICDRQSAARCLPPPPDDGAKSHRWTASPPSARDVGHQKCNGEHCHDDRHDDSGGDGDGHNRAPVS
jgi:hypothetical protein